MIQISKQILKNLFFLKKKKVIDYLCKFYFLLRDCPTLLSLFSIIKVMSGFKKY